MKELDDLYNRILESGDCDGPSYNEVELCLKAAYDLGKASRPEEQALSLLRQLVNLTEHFDDAVWYDKDNVRHPAVTPLVHTLAAEVRQYLDERQPQKSVVTDG